MCAIGARYHRKEALEPNVDGTPKNKSQKPCLQILTHSVLAIFGSRLVGSRSGLLLDPVDGCLWGLSSARCVALTHKVPSFL